ncbi:hypothetical protein [Roseomonas gilardii]|nr:hypothetical protein [Roseomonas gilardii]
MSLVGNRVVRTAASAFRLALATGLLLGVSGFPSNGGQSDMDPAQRDGGLRGTIFLRFMNAPGAHQPLAKVPKLLVSFGDEAHEAVMDTGSTGVLVAATMIPHWDTLPSLGDARLTYSSSGRVMEGRWVVTPVSIAGANGNTMTTRPMPVMAVTRISCLSNARNCEPEEMPRRVAMLGIGFARQGDHQAQSTPDRNPFLQMPATVASKVRRGYVVSRDGVRIGLRPDAIEEGFFAVSLSRSQQFDDWAPPPACISVANHVPPACGTMLMDTGVDRAFLTVPLAQLDGVTSHAEKGEPQLLPGTRIAVQLSRSGSSPWGYSFAADDAGDPVAPRGVTLVRPGQGPTFINTSFHFLNGFDYLYDAERGIVGYRARP